MRYEMEELLPLVAQLAGKYTGFESTSVTYEKAEQLMGAVLYCIAEADGPGGDAAVLGRYRPERCDPAGSDQRGTEIRPREKEQSAARAYEEGYRRVLEKAGAALELYNDMAGNFSDYGNIYLHDTVIKGMPVFFQRYDAEFEPQNTVLTLDYPILRDLSAYSGIDRIYAYLSCIRMEQMFLRLFPEEDVIRILRSYSAKYQELPENICGIVYTDFIRHMLAQKPLAEREFGETERRRIREILFHTERQELAGRLAERTKSFARDQYGNGGEPGEYVSASLGEVLVRIEQSAAAETGPGKIQPLPRAAYNGAGSVTAKP